MATAPKIHYEAEEPAAEFTDTLPETEDRHLEYDEVFSQDEETAPVVVVRPTATTFAYELGHRVQPAPEAPARQVIWRGQLRERRPETGLVHRVNVYRLNDGFWDCYREDELQAA
ncbi:hypothetical protein [Hymenobacter ruricola]|uniref:Uncharacterized protein n=1 Tax=Hymenobacter ruricola TaxID=2791023 RepID=A0ABS0I7Q1_9BACT|nr:hypothetical protein [Hymenobacter ruricola]MBF9223001.1 hypothetical protein [Hymenobacter ruricola]